MMRDQVRDLLDRVRSGATSTDDAMEFLRKLPYEDIGFAHVDHHRSLRQNLPEVILCEPKTVNQVVQIARKIVGSGADLLATRVTADQVAPLLEAVPDGSHNPTARTISYRQSDTAPEVDGEILVVCAGTSDLPVAEETLETARAMGHPASLVADVGVAGLHRLLGYIDRLRAASVIVVAAGMEGALASVVGGLVEVPIVAVPTSVGYGANFGGLSALLAMLNSCSAGITVVNIDNGFGAGVAACTINRRRPTAGEPHKQTE